MKILKISEKNEIRGLEKHLTKNFGKCCNYCLSLHFVCGVYTLFCCRLLISGLMNREELNLTLWVSLLSSHSVAVTRFNFPSF